MAITYDKNKVKVIPVRLVEHSDYNELIGIRNHQYYFVNLLSGRITYRKGTLRIATGKNTIMAAKDYVEKYLKALASGDSPEKIEREAKGIIAPLFSDLYKEAVEAKSVGNEPSTIKNYWKSWNYGLKFFWENKTVREITSANIEKFKAAYLEEYPERNFEQTQVHFGMALRHGLKHGYIKKMPDLSVLANMNEIIKKNKKWIKPGRVYSTNEIENLKQAAIEIAEGRHYGSNRFQKILLSQRALLGINLGLSGLRMKEMLALRWEKMDFKKKIMNVWSFKNHKWREVPMTDEVADLLKKQRQYTANSELVFPMPSDPERFLSNQVFDKVWWMVKESAEISDWNVENRARFHDLRHTFATMTAELGWPPKVACDVLDMSLDEYDQTYAKPSGAKKSEWMHLTWNNGSKK